VSGRDGDPVAALANYPAALRGRLEELGNRGGFSGARLWKLHTVAGAFCLRAASPAETGEHLRGRHRLMRLARAAGLTFVPAVLDTVRGDSILADAGRWWELMEWMPGVADFRAAPSEARLRAAAQALARVHVAWRGESSMPSTCPAITRRLDAVAAFLASGRRKAPVGHTQQGAYAPRSLTRRLADAVARWMPRVPAMLGDVNFPVRVQPCLRDVWHDHLLFDGDRLTGLVDYAAVGPDSVAADLARMLGSLIGDDEDGWHVGLAAYREVAALSAEEERLARRLDRAGVIVALANWHRRIDEGEAAWGGQVRRRVEDLLARVEAWPA
jgi:Ser/Thr protein kinase RdoA (MazF antagonist)